MERRTACTSIFFGTGNNNERQQVEQRSKTNQTSIDELHQQIRLHALLTCFHPLQLLSHEPTKFNSLSTEELEPE
jgi:hypothetical protein